MARRPHGMAMASTGPEDDGAEEKRHKARERVRRHRARRAAGYTSLRVDVNAQTLVWLANNGWIDEGERLDRAKLSDALSDVLYCLGEGTLKANVDEQ